ncbi:hypothetical protein BD309DRAFT_1034274 [Dichomitus squalens]|uniref:Uncharacterized protein n=1 Tax=Dichomitus squalens TaxID=114155 RepID=A0A4Q9Q618_9APHY|nr:hypothetical protein BD309DRAFT_1034274 [Dichomitus squalens]TBU62842.1 hypothetical protein BD310DRAFT_945685 [Dichomitus squalens]
MSSTTLLESFCSLPEDILVRILLSSELDAVVACKRVCRRFQRLIDGDIYLQYKIELALNGMIDGPQSYPMSVVERLQLLREYSKKYHALYFTSSEFKYSWQLWPRTGTPMTGWKFFLGFGGTISYIVVKPAQREISISVPPLFTGLREMRDWVVPYDAFMENVDREILCASADVSQDLLLVAVHGEDTRHITVYLRSLDDAERPHPCALQPTLPITTTEDLYPFTWDHERPTPLSMKSCDVQIHNNIIAWKVVVGVDVADPSDVEIWDWTEGRRIYHSPQNPEDSFTLIDDAHIVHEEWPLGLLLKVPPAHTLVSIQASSIPSPPSSDPQPFWTNPDLRVVVVRFVKEVALLIPYQTFRDALSVAVSPKQNPPHRAPYEYSIAWKDWIPRGALLVHIPRAESILHRWSVQHCYAYGS